MLSNGYTASDKNQYREQLEGYLEKVLQRGVLLRDWEGGETLPVFLSRLYWFFKTRINQTSLLFMSAKHVGEHGPVEVSKHLDRAKREFDGVVVYSAERVTAGFRARLITGGVSFAVPGNQLYIPQIAMDLREYFRAPKPHRRDKLSPSAQLILFFCLLKEGQGQSLTPTDLTGCLRYSIMTTSRGFDELADAGLARVERRGRSKFLSFHAKGRLLVDSAKTFLIRPERQLDHIRWQKEPPDLPLAGEHALARLGDINPPATSPVYAVTRDQMRDLLAAGWAKRGEAGYDSDGALETWRYDPQVLARNSVVDPLSLFAQFWDDPDERLSMSADRLLQQFSW